MVSNEGLQLSIALARISYCQMNITILAPFWTSWSCVEIILWSEEEISCSSINNAYLTNDKWLYDHRSAVVVTIQWIQIGKQKLNLLNMWLKIWQYCYLKSMHQVGSRVRRKFMQPFSWPNEVITLSMDLVLLDVPKETLHGSCLFFFYFNSVSAHLQNRCWRVAREWHASTFIFLLCPALFWRYK